ncbi:alpha/beta fold hydrolase [Streptomyces sp. SID161]|uniref:thioesterase II family protein n=1 Tax=Streptomyces sp. SID161 TaxID=2690251 RepID=UPI0013690A96|nr:alpha/beta fold hydrolase [Streptomyces sp. SID161]MYW16466.1 alpha/beta fold hydrolase [Streptomyces sp. SID2955]MYW46232.1 alpha/beta fold hydrolase [Streptomyces sp. SID161]
MTDSQELRQRWIRRYHPAPDSEVTVVCFPHAGGSASYFQPLSARLTPRAEVLALQYPGRQDRRSEPALTSVDALVDGVVDALRDHAGRPLVFFGHSMGGTLAFETARRMEAELDGRLLGLVVSGRRSPGSPRQEAVHLRDDAGLIAQIRKLDGTSSALLDDEDVVRMIIPALRADYTAVERYAYRPGPALSCPLRVYTGDTDPQVRADEATAWAEYTRADFRVRTFTGGHFYLAERGDEVIAALREDMTAFQERASSGAGR